MILEWFNSRKAIDIGAELADQFAHGTASRKSRSPDEALQEILRRVEEEVRSLRLNFYKRAKFANSFQWRLIESGIDKERAQQVTQTLIVHLAVKVSGSAQENEVGDVSRAHPDLVSAHQLLARGNKFTAQGAYTDAISCYQDVVRLEPRNVAAHNNLGAALLRMGRVGEAEGHFRQAIKKRRTFPTHTAILAICCGGEGESPNPKIFFGARSS